MSEKKEHPLILVMYMNRDLMQDRDFANMISTKVDDIIREKDANIISFFLPTDGEERIECINPVQIEPAKMDKIMKMVDEIATNFLVPMDNVDIIDALHPVILKNLNTEGNINENWDYLGYLDDDGYRNIDNAQELWLRTLLTKINYVSHKILLNNHRVGGNLLLVNSNNIELMDNLMNLTTNNTNFEILYTDKIPDDKIYVLLDLDKIKGSFENDNGEKADLFFIVEPSDNEESQNTVLLDDEYVEYNTYDKFTLRLLEYVDENISKVDNIISNSIGIITILNR